MDTREFEFVMKNGLGRDVNGTVFVFIILRMLSENRLSKFPLAKGLSAMRNFSACGDWAWSTVYVCRPHFHGTSRCDSLRAPG